MKDKIGNIILAVILVILMIVAIAIVIINPNKIKNSVKTDENSIENMNINSAKNTDEEQLNEQEELENSMQVGGTFCKVGNQIAFYQDESKSIYLYDVNSNKTNKIATLENGANKIYFDGENIYAIPYYYRGKGIYKIDLQGNTKKISEEASLQLWITENEIYFVKQIGFDVMNQNPQGNICVMDKDGNNVIEIAQNIKNNFFLQNDKIYYTTQDRKMYAINKDGSNQEELVQGRKFAIDVSEKYLLYIDYASQEAEHILNLETKEDSIIGYFGLLKKFQGKTYLNARKRTDDGSIETEFTLFEIEENGTVKEVGKVADFGLDLKYITNGKAYIYSQQDGTYSVNLENKQKENVEDYKTCRYFLGGYGYKIDDSNLDDIKIEKIKLQN